MTRHVLWQAVLALVGIALVFIVLFQLVSNVTTVTTVEVPVAGGTYIEGIVGYTEAINPILAPNVVHANPIDQDLSALVFDSLTKLDETGLPIPSLATDWEVSEDGTVYEFSLRPGVTWHDGAPFTSTDVAFTIQSMQDPEYQGPPALGDLWRHVMVEQIDSLAIRLTLDEPFPSFIFYTTIGVLPAHLLGNVPAGDLLSHEFSTQQPIGTGMFQVESMAADRVVLAANPEYWEGRPTMDGLEFWLYETEQDLLTAYGAGEIHGFHLERPYNFPDLTAYPDLQFYSAPATGVTLSFLNLQRESLPFFQDVEVRQALLFGLDRQALVDQVLAGQGLVAHSPVMPMLWAYDPMVKRYAHDPERAIGLLDASGWMDTDGDLVRDKDGVELAFTLLTNDDPTMVQMAEGMIQQWKAIGVDATLRSTTPAAASTFVLNRNFDAALIDLGLVADPDPYPLWHSTQASETGQNLSGFASEEADIVMEAIRATTDLEELVALYQRFQQIFAEQVPALLLYHPIYTYAVDAQVQQVQLSPMLHTSDRFQNVAEWTVETEEIQVSEEEPLDKIDE